MLNFTKLIITLYLQLVLKSVVQTTNYCEPQLCGNSKSHTMCIYKSETPAQSCVKYEKIIKSVEDKQAILNKINNRRNKVASGDIRSLPPAANMMKVEWNEELELFAQRWADQCVKHPADLDTCRDTETAAVGQNIATVYGESPGLNPFTLVDLWYMELFNANTSIIAGYRRSSMSSEHYNFFTQLVWAETSQVGCGGVKFQEVIDDNSNRKRTVYRLVCNFLPSGNIVGQPVYKEGDPCNQCPEYSSCDVDFTHLCSLVRASKFSTTLNFGKFTSEHTSKIESDEKTAENKRNVKENDHINNDSITEIQDAGNETSFDYFSHLFDYNKVTELLDKPITSSCKGIFAVDELIKLLKKNLVTDNSFKEMLLSTKSTLSESKFSDSKVDAIVSRIYSKKTTPLSTKATESDVVNSTLLADLVEAVIFRNRDKISTMAEDTMDTQMPSDVSPVRVRAELGYIDLKKQKSPISTRVCSQLRSKRESPFNKNMTYNKKRSLCDDREVLTNYKAVLQDLASDLRELKLNEKFHCAHGASFLCLCNIYVFLILSLFYLFC
ncbi:uncharacterized protein LOC126979730 isoform X2 [Leptidea sinapis]|uniref:uncharacterized protein LOC126979730 isoform X2 n=1 Tax=Leptidea sinapis TaxID=189913 RepID=UPI0021C4238F|nr:uncharacterized protein LOC126979730 isoform X2 [Leptidea sinapis]